MLKSDPDDVFLHYALALEDISAGDVARGIAGLEDVLRRDADYVPAYFQLGQRLADTGEAARAKAILRTGIEAARRKGDAHAESEMSGFLAMLDEE
jgi:Tfp pilus assembly protein PilF